MDDAVGAKLRELLTPSVRDELLDDPRRLAELVRERLGIDRRREASFLNTVMQEGVPKRLLAMPAGSLTSAMIANYARKVSEDTGLKEDVARSAIDVWSVGLGLSASVSELRSDSATGPELNQMANTPEGKEHPAIVFESRDTKEMRGIGLLIIIVGVAAMLLSKLFSEFDILARALPIFTVAAASMYAGLVLVLISYSPPAGKFRDGGLTTPTPPGLVLWITMAVCVIDSAALYLYLTIVISVDRELRPSLQTWDILPLTVLVGTAFLFFPVIIYRLYNRSAPIPVAATLNLLDPVAIMLLVRGLFGLWVFDMNLEGDRHVGWLRPELPLDLAMIFISVVILVGWPRLVHKAVIAAVCSVSAIFYVCDLRLLSGLGGGQDWKMLDEIGIVANVVVLGLLLFGYLRRRNTVAQAA
jgi:hypothetical protein